MRDAWHRWATAAVVILTLTAAAMRHSRRARHRRKYLRKLDAWPW